MKHTPGPWMQATHSPTDVLADGRMMIATARDGLNGIARDEAVANARLIARAPEFRAALAWALDQIEDDLDPSHQAALANARSLLKD